MTTDEAAWIREHVWTQPMRKTHRDVPGYYNTCACQYGLTSWCQHGQCGRCHRGAPLPGPAGYVGGRGGQAVMVFAQPYEHPTPSATGLHKTSAAMFWYADRVCRWVCPCGCHSTGRKAAVQIVPSTEGALFDLAVSV